MFNFVISRSARIRPLVGGAFRPTPLSLSTSRGGHEKTVLYPLVGGGAFRPTPSLPPTGSRGLAFVERGKINPTGRTRSLMSRPATQQPWRTFKAFFSDGADDVDDFPMTSLPQETDKVDCLPEPLSSPETGGAREEGQGQKQEGTKGESGTSGGDGDAAKKRDLSDRVLVLETTMSEKLTNIEGRLNDIRTDLRDGRIETYRIIKIFLRGLVIVCGTAIGGVLFKLLYMDTHDKQQAQADLQGAMLIAEERIGKEIGTVRGEVHQVRDKIVLVYGEVRGIRGEMKGVFQTLRSRWF